MNRDLLKKLVKEILNEATEADMKRLRRAVILSIFSSEIPNLIKRDLNSALSGAPDADVRKVTRVFLDQVLKDEETLNASSEYEKLKQDPEFQRLSNNLNQKIRLDNKAGILDLSNVAFTASDISKPFSYSTLLYHAAEKETQTLLQFFIRKYGKDFTRVLYSMLPRQSRPAIKPTKENLDELDLSAMIQSKYPAEDLDKELGTKLAKKYTYPAGYNEDTIEREITNIQPQNSKFNSESYQEKVDEVYNLLVQMNRPALGGIKADTHQKKWDLIYGVISHFNPDDIKFFVEQWKGGEVPEGRAYFDTVANLEKKFDVPINWIPSPKNLYTIIDAIDKKFIQK